MRVPFAVFLFFLQLTASAQLPILKWAKPFHANNTAASRDYSNGRCIATDKDGHVYTAGFFSHTVDFVPGPAVFNLTGADGIGNKTTNLLANSGNVAGIAVLFHSVGVNVCL